MTTIFSFDLGTGSIGEAVRKIENNTDEIVHAASLLIDSEVASISDAANRRRQKRTRDAHKAREK